MENGVFHGEGELTYCNDDIYRGQFKFGRKDGKGVYHSFRSDNYYHSEWVEDLMHGECEIIFGTDKSKPAVNIGIFNRGKHQMFNMALQDTVMKSFSADQYSYTPNLDESLEDEKIEFDIYEMLRSAFFNNDQKIGDKSKFLSNQFSYKIFEDEQSMIGSFPINLLKSFQQFIQIENIFLPSIMPCGLSKYVFSKDESVFHGPFEKS